MSKTFYLTDKQSNALCFRIIKKMNGIPISQARHILEEASRMLMDFHLVDIENPQYKIKAEEFGKS